MPTLLKVLILEDRESDAKLMLHELREVGYEPHARLVDNEAEFTAALEPSLDIIFVDYNVPGWNGASALTVVQRSGFDIPVIVVSGSIGEDIAVQMMKLGACDFLLKPNLARLGPSVQRELREAASRRARYALESKLRHQQQLFKAIVEKSSEGLSLVDRHGRVTYGSPASERILGRQAKEFLGQSAFRYVHPDDVGPITADFERLAQQPGASLVREVRALHKDGTWRCLEVSATNRLDDPSVRAVILLHRDITERKSGEAALRLQSATLEAAANAVMITDCEGRIEYANPAFCNLTGYTLAEAVGKSSRDLVKSGQQGRAFYEGLWTTILANRVWRGELVNRRKDGSVYPEEMTITPVCDPPGKIAHFVAIKQDLSERKRAEAALRQSEERYRLLFEHAPEALIIIGANGTFTALNHGFEAITGWSKAEWIGRPFHELIHPDDRAHFAGFFQQLLSGERTLPTEFRARHAAGGFHDIEFTGFSSYRSDGSIEVQGIGRDITERKKAEEALQLFRTLLDRSTDAIEVVDFGTGKFLDINEQACRSLGYSRGELLELTVQDVTVGIDRAKFEAVNEQLRERGNVLFEGVHRRKDGSTYWCSVNLTLVTLDHDYVLAIDRDITEQKRTELQLREQTEVLTNAHEGLMVVNSFGKITLWNHGAETIFGWPAAEALGRLPTDVLGVVDPCALDQMADGVERDGFWSGELRLQARDGHKVTVDCRTTLFRDEAGRPRAQLNFLADITEKKLLEEKLFHMQRLESIGMLAAGIAHDLNNVLAPVVFAAPMLRNEVSDARGLKILDSLEQSAERGTALVKQILGFIQSTTGEFESIQVKHLARDIIGFMEETFPKSISVEHDIPSDLWPVQGNATQIHQVLLNLCVNARDAMPQGGSLRVVAANRHLDDAEAGAIPGARTGDWVMLEVDDSGTGIAPDVLERIWMPFFTTKSAGQGTGLGLSTVRGIVERHHGFTELHTEVGQGTTFRVFLPATGGRPLPANGVSKPAIPHGHGELLLVVDDDASIRDMVSEILKDYGYRVAMCADGVEALAEFNTHSSEFSAVVTDVDMPRLGGAALAREVLHIRPDIRLVVMSGLALRRGNGSDLEEIRKMTSVIIPKPFKGDDLLGAIDRVLHPPEGI